MTATTRHVTTPAAPDWSRALCTQTDPDAFFPEGRGVEMALAVVRAKQVCNRCPIRLACLDGALERGERFGVWGGLDEVERRKLKRAPFSHKEVCEENRDLITARVAGGASMRSVADELGVGPWAVRRVLAGSQASAAVEEVAAA